MQVLNGATLTPFSEINFASKQRALYYVQVGPKEAAQLLDIQDNRRLRTSRWNRYAGSMSRGEYMMPPSLVQFDTRGLGFNGQHTLHAIRSSGTTQVLKIEVGCDPDERKYSDDHAPKTISDRHNMSPDLAQVLNLVAIAVTGDAKPNAAQIDAAREELEHWYYAPVAARKGGAKRPFTSPAVTAGAMFQIRMHPTRKQEILDAYSALMDTTGSAKPCAMANLAKWLTDPINKAHSGGQARFRTLAASLTAFDPDVVSGKTVRERSMSTAKMHGLLRGSISLPGQSVAKKPSCSPKRQYRKRVEDRPAA